MMQVKQSISFRFWDGLARAAYERAPRVEDFLNTQAAKYYVEPEDVEDGSFDGSVRGYFDVFQQISMWAAITTGAAVKDNVSDCPELVDAVDGMLFLILDYRMFAIAVIDPATGDQLWVGEHTSDIRRMMAKYTPFLSNVRSSERVAL